jgi:pimeloyl-ACP methyl ester carboxylesterase
VNEPQISTYRSGRLNLNLLCWGNAGAPPLILVHGGRDHARAWDDVARRLGAKYHVLVPDLRGHGDSDWALGGGYIIPDFVLDLATLIDEKTSGPVTLIGHSLGGNIALRTAGLYPERVAKLVSIEGLGPSPQMVQEMAAKPVEARLRGWIDEQRSLAKRAPRLYPNLEAALERMLAQNPHLTAGQAKHLTSHGVRQTESGQFVWKYDPFLRSWPPVDLSRDEIRSLWGRITCPVLLAYGSASWASNPATDGRAAQFQNASVELIEGAGHWLHHDRFEAFMNAVERFLG